jgi:hypothetical protein
MDDVSTAMALAEATKKNSLVGKWTYLNSVQLSPMRFPGTVADNFMFVEGKSTAAMISVAWTTNKTATTYLTGELGMAGYKRLDPEPIQVRVGNVDGQMVRYQGSRDCVREVECRNGARYYFLFFRGASFSGPAGAFDRTLEKIRFRK